MNKVTLSDVIPLIPIEDPKTDILAVGLRKYVETHGVKEEQHGCFFITLKDGSKLVSQNKNYPTRLKHKLSHFEKEAVWWIRTGPWVLFINETAVN